MKSSKQILDREFLELRSKLLDIAASLDRIDRSEMVDNTESPLESASHDDRMQLIDRAIEVISTKSVTADRAQQIQHLFSREFDPQWKQKFKMPPRN